MAGCLSVYLISDFTDIFVANPKSMVKLSVKYTKHYLILCQSLSMLHNINYLD